MTGPVRSRSAYRRATDHIHPEYWTEADHQHFESQISGELKELRKDVEKLGTRLTWLFGGISLGAFLITILAPFVRIFLGMPQ